MFFFSFAFSGVLSLISIWILNAFYLGITVFLADYCVSPDQFITTFAEKKQTKNSKFNFYKHLIKFLKYIQFKLFNILQHVDLVQINYYHLSKK